MKVLITAWSKSAASTKRRGDRGSSCLTPLTHLKLLPETPFNKTTDCPEKKMIFIQLSRTSLKPSRSLSYCFQSKSFLASCPYNVSLDSIIYLVYFCNCLENGDRHTRLIHIAGVLVLVTMLRFQTGETFPGMVSSCNYISNSKSNRILDR